jgi:putative transposase
MPRQARIVVPGHPYHVTQRGNSRQPIFQEDYDRLQYLSWITDYSLQYHLSVLGYCLMDNHVHLIVLPQSDNALAKTLSITHMRYAQYFNKKRNGSGHLWQGRFYSCILDESYLTAALRYVERNPVRAKMVEQPWEWEWSSAAAHVGQTDGRIPLVALNSLTGMSAHAWKQFINAEDSTGEFNEIRTHTMTGRPLGTDSFITRLSRLLGKRLKALPRGRPRKAHK